MNTSAPASSTLPDHRSGSPQSTRTTSVAILAALLVLRTILLLLGDGVTYGIAKALHPDATIAGVLLYSNVFVVAVDIITIAVLAAVLRREGKTLRSLFDRFRLSDIPWGLLLFVIAMVGFFVATYIGNLLVYQGPPPTPAGPRAVVPLWLALWSIIVLPATVALAEESLYRGYLQTRLTAHFGLWVGLLIPALFFGLQHLAFSLTTPQAATSRVIAMTLVGVMLGALYLWRKRLGQLIIAHWMIDVVGLGLPLLLIAQ